MSERGGQPDDPDAVDRDQSRPPDPEGPHPGRRDADEGMMRLPGEEAPAIVGAGVDTAVSGEDPEAPDDVGSSDDP